MSMAPTLHWLPADEGVRAKLRALAAGPADIDAAVAIANTRLDFSLTNALDATVGRLWTGRPASLGAEPVRLAMLGSSTLAHLHPAVRMAGLRRGMWVETYENDYGQYVQELSDPTGALQAFAPTTILFAFDARHLVQGLDAGADAAQAAEWLDATLAHIRRCWSLARTACDGAVLQQTALDVFPALLGSNEHRLPGSRRAAIGRLNTALRGAADTDGVGLIALDDRAARDGLGAWHDPLLWYRAKQEVTPAAAPVWGDLVGRVIAAHQGRTHKALVLDLDDTLWGGVIGDDGLGGIVLGQGSALGEGFAAVQDYAKELSRRGIILAVASKNDEANARTPFERHPEMVLRPGDIAAFRADWNDKAGNIRALAQDLNIGLDAMVFLDDNPFERSLVRQELPMVAVPEVPDDPALVPQALADAGYFETLAVTADDRNRTLQYRDNREREKLKADATDLGTYLRTLAMRLRWSRFDDVGLHRIVQLINKTNQFNLTTRRYSETEVTAIMADPRSFGLQMRLLDRFGDNGIVAIVIGRLDAEGGVAWIDTWLMSCRVLGRQVEAATLNLVAAHAKQLGAGRLIGEYVPTGKNGIVAEHYVRLGFSRAETRPGGGTTAVLDLATFAPIDTFIAVEEVA